MDNPGPMVITALGIWKDSTCSARTWVIRCCAKETHLEPSGPTSTWGSRQYESRQGSTVPYESSSHRLCLTVTHYSLWFVPRLAPGVGERFHLAGVDLWGERDGAEKGPGPDLYLSVSFSLLHIWTSDRRSSYVASALVSI